MNKTVLNFAYVILFMALGIFLYYSTQLSYLVDGRPLFPAETQDKTAVYVRFLAISLMVCTLILAIKTLLLRDNSHFTFIQNPKKFFTLVAILIIYAIALNYLGFFAATIFYLPITMYLMGYRNYKIIIFSSVFLLALVYVVFVQFFSVPLPEGILM